MRLIRRLLWGLLRSLVTFVVLIGLVLIALVLIQKFAGFNAFDEAKKTYADVMSGSWKRKVGSFVGGWFLLWLAYDMIAGPNYGQVNSNQANNYRNGRGFIDLDGNGRDDRWQR